MSDEQSSGAEYPLGQPEQPPSEGGEPLGGAAEEVSSTLAALEQKLRDLERELGSLDHIQAAAGPSRATEDLQPPLAAEPEQQPPAAEPPPSPRLIDESLTPPAAGPADRAEAPPASAEAPEDQSLREALLAFGERLARVTRELSDDYNELLAAVTGRPGGAGQPTPGRPATTAPGASAAEPLGEPALSGPAEEQVLFDGHVEIAVGPFFEIAALSAFESNLARLANVAETSVRRFEASHAVIDVQLTAPTPLVLELRSIADGTFRARPLAENRLAITFDE